jgi:hypothetical protein
VSTISPGNQQKSKFAAIRGWFIKELWILACLLLLMICGGEAVWIVAQRAHRAVDQAIIAGTTRQEIEQKFGEPRWISQPGQPLSDVGWNGSAKDNVVKSRLFVYSAPPFAFIVCEFDEKDILQKAIISPK